MKSTNYEIRAKAREALDRSIFSSSWMMSLVVVLIVSLILSAASYISCGIGTYLLTGPLNVGLSIAFLKLIRRQGKMEISTAFEGLNDFGSNLMVGLMTTVYVSLWTLLFIVPGIIKSYSYALVYYIKADHPEYGWRECLDESERLMRGNRLRLFKLQLGFIGWIIVGSLCCGIGTLWVNPYIQASVAVFYDELVAENVGYNASYTESTFGESSDGTSEGDWGSKDQ